MKRLPSILISGLFVGSLFRATLQAARVSKGIAIPSNVMGLL
ncbi:MAG: hypothetical protein ACI8UZ_001563 [Akkermansiaceae bacterium]|jgi:hypothetical protein